MVVVVESMPAVRSAAFSFFVPAGAAYDPAEKEGAAAVLCDMVLRGAGPRNSRQLINDLDNLGVDRSEGVSSEHTSFGGATLADALPGALEMYADILRRPHLPDNQLNAARAIAIQELRALEDDPQQKVIVELRRRHYPHPWGRPSEGSLAGLEAVTSDDVQRRLHESYRPNGTILGIAGNVSWPETRDLVERLFGDWEARDEPEVGQRPAGPRWDYINQQTAQTQIGIAYPSVPYRDPEYYQAAAAVGVLSGGMSARLFTEVREKRGLCYAVYATHSTRRDEGTVLCYAGTTPERAQETLEVTLSEIRRLADGIEQSELDRVKARVKSALIMQQESTSARAGALAGDWYHLGRVRTLQEIRQAVESQTCETLVEHLNHHPAEKFTILTLGPEPLEMPGGIPSDEAR